MPTPPLRSLDSRLQHLFDTAQLAEYDTIWDTCCDHGLLGLHLHRELNRQNIENAGKPAKTALNLVDCVPEIIQVLNTRYNSYKSPSLHFLCADATTLQLASGQRNLVIIAGVGGNTVQVIVAALIQQAPTLTELDFLISANTAPYELRQYLAKAPLSLLSETYVQRSKWGYEHLHLRYSPAPQAPTSDCGQKIWQEITPEKNRYLRKLAKHYARIAIRQPQYQAVSQQYQALSEPTDS